LLVVAVEALYFFVLFKVIAGRTSFLASFNKILYPPGTSADISQ